MAAADRVVVRAVADRVFPGAVLAVGRRGGLVHLRPFGRLSFELDAEPVRVDTIYDLASVTKVVATTAVAMVLVDRGQLSLDAAISSWFPEFALAPRSKVRVRDLLAHTSGLPAWAALSREAQGKAGVVRRILEQELLHEPGTHTVYSDLGMILLGEILERQAGARLDELARRLVFEPLGMKDTLYSPPAGLRTRVAPTGEDRWRGRSLRGEVHDENAYAMGGVAGHAGLFSTAVDLARFAAMMLGGGAGRGARIVSSETLERFVHRVDIAGSTRTLGFDLPAGDPWAGSMWSPRAYGHTGQTGTALWIDPQLDVYVVLLTNRSHGGDTGEAFNRVRKEISDAVLSALVLGKTSIDQPAEQDPPRHAPCSATKGARAAPRRGVTQGVASPKPALTRRNGPRGWRSIAAGTALPSLPLYGRPRAPRLQRSARWTRALHLERRARRAPASGHSSSAGPRHRCGCGLWPTGQRRPEGVAPGTRNASLLVPSVAVTAFRAPGTAAVRACAALRRPRMPGHSRQPRALALGHARLSDAGAARTLAGHAACMIAVAQGTLSRRPRASASGLQQGPARGFIEAGS